MSFHDRYFNKYTLKFNNMISEKFEIRSTKAPGQCDWRRYGFFIVKFVSIVEFDLAKIYDCKRLLRKKWDKQVNPEISP